MAINTKQARRDAERKRKLYFDNYMADFCSLFHNAVEVENLPNDLPKRYLLKILLTKGGIAFDKQTNLYLPFVEKGIDVYGLPISYNLIGFNGITLERLPEEVVILRANDLLFPIVDYMEQQIEKLVDYDLAIEQNLDAIKTMTIAEVSDESQLLSLANEVQARKIGATVVVKNKNTMQGAEIKVSSTGAQYLVDKLRQDRKECLNETLSKIGINVANVDKKERVQGAEIRASQGYALDSINTLIDTFNYDAKCGNLLLRLKGKTSLFIQNELDLEKQRLENIMLMKGENSNNETNG